ncbi:MAG: 50S ribosomal protein L9 [Alphaproteobacteria bacterium]|nr:50S ribosomal protein L9 [Alphaproteobacteria bacterium]
MEIILLERIEKLGQMGDVVNVKTGYARNYLLPQKKAMRSNKANLALFEVQKVQIEAMNLERRKEAEVIAEKMNGLKIAILRQAGETGQLYGSVTGRDICSSIKEAGFTVYRSQVELSSPIKELGGFDISIRLHSEVTQLVKLDIARSQAELDVAEKAVAKAVAKAELEEKATEETSSLVEAS